VPLRHELMRTVQTSLEGEMAPGALSEFRAKQDMSGGFSFDALLDGPDEVGLVQVRVYGLGFRV
jgi:hypothetical protein